MLICVAPYGRTGFYLRPNNISFVREIEHRMGSTKHLKEIRGKLFLTLVSAMISWIWPKSQAYKIRIEKWDYNKFKKLLHSKENNQQDETTYILFIRVKSHSIMFIKLFTMKEFNLLINAFSNDIILWFLTFYL